MTCEGSNHCQFDTFNIQQQIQLKPLHTQQAQTLYS